MESSQMAKKPKNMFDLLEGIELIQAQRKRSSQNAKILFGETISAVIKKKDGEKVRIGPRDKAKQEWQMRN